MHRTLASVLVLLAALACAGCPASSESGTPPANSTGGDGAGGGKTYRIAVIPKGTTHEFWKSVHAGARRAADELGNVEIFWKGPILENDTDGQISVVQDFVTRGVDGIVLAPNDSRGLVDAVRDAKEAGVPTVIFDSGLEDEESLVSYVATDNYNGGVLAARALAEALNGKGNVILLRYKQGSESTEQREQGFIDTIEKEFTDIEILEKDQYAGTTPEQSLDVAQQMLNRFRGELHGIFAVCEPNATGVLGALEDAGLAGEIKFVGFDPSERMVEAMRDDKMQGIVLQDPVMMGYEAVKTMVAHLNGKQVDKRIPTGEHVATPANMDTPEMQKLLNPPRHEE